MTKHRITIDPGVELGWAVWDLADESVCPPVASGVITSKKDGDWFSRLGSVCRQTCEVISQFGSQGHGRITKGVVEYPAFFPSDGGRVVAEAGDLVKLAFAAGMQMGVLHENNLKTSIVTVNEWKGQLTKEMVMRRIRRKLGDPACRGFKTHAWDAIGIGLYLKGQF